MHSKGMYLGLQGTRILVGFLRVSVVVRQKACMHAIGANNIRTGEGLTWRRQQIEYTLLQVGCALEQPAAWSCHACGPRRSIGDSSRALETSRHAIHQKSTPIKYEAAVVIQASAGLALVSVSRQSPVANVVRKVSALRNFLSFFLSLFEDAFKVQTKRPSQNTGHKTQPKFKNVKQFEPIFRRLMSWRQESNFRIAYDKAQSDGCSRAVLEATRSDKQQRENPTSHWNNPNIMKHTVRTCVVCTLSLTTTHAFVAPAYNLGGTSLSSRLQCPAGGAARDARAPTGVLSLRAKIGVRPSDEVSFFLMSIIRRAMRLRHRCFKYGVCFVVSWLCCCVEFSMYVWWNLENSDCSTNTWIMHDTYKCKRSIHIPQHAILMLTHTSKQMPKFTCMYAY